MNPNIDHTTARPNDTAFNIEGNQPSTQHEANICYEHRVGLQLLSAMV